MCVVKKIIGTISKTGKETISMFGLIIVEVRDSFHVEKLVKKPTSSPPLDSITIDREIPRVGIHPWRFGQQKASSKISSDPQFKHWHWRLSGTLVSISESRRGV